MSVAVHGSLVYVLNARDGGSVQGFLRTGAAARPGPDPHGKVVVSVYSSGAIGRLVPDGVAGLVRHVREHTPASA